MDLRRTSPPITRAMKLGVVSIEDVKAQARVTHDSEDNLIGDYIEAAFDYLSGPEGWLNGYCLLEERYEFHTASIGDRFETPLRPLRQIPSAISIEWRRADGTYSDLDTNLFYAMTVDDVPLIRTVPHAVWPGSTVNPHPLTYRISVLVGHANASEVPTPIRQSMKMLAAYWFNQREAVGPAGRAAAQSIPFGLTALCGRYRMAHDHS